MTKIKSDHQIFALETPDETRALLAEYATELFGPTWRPPLADATGYTTAAIGHWMNKTAPPLVALLLVASWLREREAAQLKRYVVGVMDAVGVVKIGD